MISISTSSVLAPNSINASVIASSTVLPNFSIDFIFIPPTFISLSVFLHYFFGLIPQTSFEQVLS